MWSTSGGRQQIRSKLTDFHDKDDEYETVHSLEGDDELDVPEYRPAALPSHAKPPAILATKAKERQSKRSIKAKVTYDEGDASLLHAKNVVQQGQEGFSTPLERPQDHSDGSSKTNQMASPALVGLIQERSFTDREKSIKAQADNVSSPGSQVEAQGTSRFAALRKLDRDAGLLKGTSSKVATKPIVERSSRSARNIDDTWLDEDGQKMSAFRKNRLLRQGLSPPQIQAKMPHEVHTDSPLQQEDQGASGSISAPELPESDSIENTNKVAAMSQEDIQKELDDVREALGDGFIDMLIAKNSMKRHQVIQKDLHNDVHEVEERKQSDTKDTQEKLFSLPDLIEATPERIHHQYFKNEPEIFPNSLQWMKEDAKDSTELEQGHQMRFHFEGTAIESDTFNESETRLAGLHHHGQDQSRPGYSTEELLYLARSLNPGQRVMALQTIGRIVTRYPETVNGLEADGEDYHVSTRLLQDNVRGQASIIASWYIEDRQINVRAAALKCIRACLLSSIAGSSPFEYTEPPERKQKDKSQDRPTSSPTQFPDVLSDEFASNLLTPLLNLLTLPDVTMDDTERTLDILCFVCTRSQKISKVVVNQQRPLSRLIDICIKQQNWPPSSLQATPRTSLLTLFGSLVRSSRENALELYERGYMSAFLRFLAVPPWVLPSQFKSDAWIKMAATLDLYSSLGCFGIGAADFGKHFSIFAKLIDWLRNESVSDRTTAEIQAVFSSAFRLFSVWTVCATDVHQTSGHHDITWSQTSEWWEMTTTLFHNAVALPTLAFNHSHLSIYGNALRLLDNWLEGARLNGDLSLDRVTREIESYKHLYHELIVSCTSALLKESEQLNTVTGRRGGLSILQKCFQTTSQICQVGSALISFSSKQKSVVIENASSSSLLYGAACSLLTSVEWSRLQEDDAVQAGIAHPLRFIISFIYESICFGQDEKEKLMLRWCQLLRVLQKGDENLAKTIVNKHLKSLLETSAASALHVLSPFINENLRSANQSLSPPLYPRSISEISTQFYSCQRQVHIEHDADIDPISGATLWKSKASGLPLRADWSLIALDDLLHSANCASLNRPHALTADWDANELEIVQSSLLLSLHLWSPTSSCTERDGRKGLPSPSEVYLGIMKVFLLEEEQPNSHQATGLITGRDLFRNPVVSELLGQMFHLASSLEVSQPSDNESLESATTRQYGRSIPFYQIYSDLIGVYDAISFGAELFGRILTLPLTLTYASDYRRLLWVDYNHILPTITTDVASSPQPLDLYVGKESDEAVIAAYVKALVTGRIHKDRNELLFAIATGTLGELLWNNTEDTEQGRSIARKIFQYPSPEAHLIVAQHKIFHNGARKDDELTRRKALLTTFGVIYPSASRSIDM